MRALFWRRRNTRFVTRLHTVVATYEHVRKSLRRQPPRVVIDTSFMCHSPAQDQPEAALSRAEVSQHHAVALREEAEAERAHMDCLRAELQHELTAHLEAQAECEQVTCERAHADKELAMLREVARLDELAIAREAEAREQELAARQELDALRQETRRLKAAIEDEAAAREEAEMQLEAASQRATETQRALMDLHAMVAHHEHVDSELEARQREATARNEIATLRNHAAGLQASLERNQAARRRAEAECAACEQASVDAERELALLGAATDELELAEQRATHAHEQALAASRDAELERARVEELQEHVRREQAAHTDAEARREAAAKRAVETQQELATMREAAERRALAETQAGQAREREQAARQEVQARREQAVQLAAQADRERARRHAAEAEREAHARLEAEARQALAALAQAEAKRTHGQTSDFADAETDEGHADDMLHNGAASSDHVQSRVAVARTAMTHDSDLTTQVNARWFIKSTREIATDIDEASDGPQTPRRDQRMNSHTPATLWGRDISQPLQCTMLDRSASGALLEFAPDRYITEITELFVGDELTLAFGTTQDRTSVVCQVVWIRARRCGIRFCGQFQTQINKPRKVTRDKPVMDKAKPARPARPRMALGFMGKPNR